MSKPTSYSSAHAPVTTIIRGEIGTIDLSSYFKKKRLQDTSRFLADLQDSKNYVRYSTEADIQSYVEDYLKDVLRGVGLQSKVNIFRQASLSLELKADIWIVKSMTGRPIGVIEVKSPSDNILENKKVCGQLFDYMVKLRTSYGQCELIGVLTNLKEWRFGWFRDSAVIAQSNLVTTSIKSPADAFPLNFESRELIMSKIYTLSCSELPGVLATCLLKNLNCSYRPVPLISQNRVYQQLNQDGFLWQSFPSSLENNSDLKFSLPDKQTRNFKVLRYFHRGSDGKVALVATDSFHFVVFKYFDKDENRQHEEELWNRLYEQNVYSQKVFSRMVLILPFVFYCQVDHEKKEISFNFDLSRWGCEEKVEIEDNPVLSHWSQLFSNFYLQRGFSPRTVAVSAIEKLASAKVVHRDLEWRHVSLLPTVSLEREEVEDMIPVFIDLTTIVEVETKDLAMDEMNMRLSEISEGYSCD